MEIIFTEHSKERMKKRGVTEDEIMQAIKTPDNTKKKGRKYFSQKNIGRATIEVVYEKDSYLKVITVYYL